MIKKLGLTHLKEQTDALLSIQNTSFQHLSFPLYFLQEKVLTLQKYNTLGHFCRHICEQN